MTDIYLAKTANGFQPATEIDADKCSSWKIGDVIRVKAQKPRNGKHHRKGMALLNLGFEYWEPRVSFLTAGERHMANVIAERLDAMGGGTGVIIEQVMQIAKAVEDSRRDKIGELEKSFEAYRKDITVKAGFYELERGPSGIVKTAQSISYDKMSQESFSEWYKAAFGIIWNETLSKHFESEQQAEQAVNNMFEYV